MEKIAGLDRYPTAKVSHILTARCQVLLEYSPLECHTSYSQKPPYMPRSHVHLTNSSNNAKAPNIHVRLGVTSCKLFISLHPISHVYIGCNGWAQPYIQNSLSLSLCPLSLSLLSLSLSHTNTKLGAWYLYEFCPIYQKANTFLCVRCAW